MLHKIRNLHRYSFALLEAAREGRRLVHGGWTVLIAVAVTLVAQFVGAILIIIALAFRDPAILEAMKAGVAPDLTSSGDATGLGLTLVLGFVLIYPLLWLWLRFGENRSFASVGFRGARPALKFGRGFLFGLAAMAAIAIGLYGAGFTELTAATPLGESWLVTAPALLLVVGWIIQGTAEETVARGLVLQSVGARHGVWAGIVVSTALFTLGHGTNPNTTPLFFANLVLYSLFTAIYALREGGLWGVAGFHGAWNLAQGNIFGFAVSGAFGSPATLMAFQDKGYETVTGGATGVEGGVAATLVLLLCCLVVMPIRDGFAAASAQQDSDAA